MQIIHNNIPLGGLLQASIRLVPCENGTQLHKIYIINNIK